jgi:hypothetical protein
MARELARLILLVAVLLMPLGMSSATAAAPSHHDMAGMMRGHCPDQAPAQHHKAGFAECTMACAAALPAVEAPGAPAVAIATELPRSAAAHQLHGLHPETATPPPRAS